MSERDNKGRFKEGNPGKPSGAKNKASRELRKRISDFIEKNIDQIESDINEMEPKERVKVFIQLMEYAIPKMRSIEADITQDESLTDTERAEIIEQMKRKYLNTKNEKDE